MMPEHLASPDSIGYVALSPEVRHVLRGRLVQEASDDRLEFA